jgi:chromosome segregation ATPase
VMGDAFKPPVQDKPRNSESKNNDSAKNESSRSNGGAKSSPEQKSRDSDRKRILEDELKSAEDKLAELKKEFNNGEPERRGDERNFAKYQERTTQLKADVTRAEADVSALKREIGNLRD